jgi:hypothetical protein
MDNRHKQYKQGQAAQRDPLKQFVAPFFSVCVVLYSICACLTDRFFEPVNRCTAAMTAFLLTGLVILNRRAF